MNEGLEGWGLLPLVPSPRPPTSEAWSPDFTWLGLLPAHFPPDAHAALQSFPSTDRHALLTKLCAMVVATQDAGWKATRCLLVQAYKHHMRVALGTLPRGPRPTYFMQVEGLGMSSASALLRALDSYRPKTPPDKGKFFADCRTMGIPPGDRVLAWALYHNSDPLPPPLMRTSAWRPPRATESVPLPPPPSPGGGTASD